MLDKEGRGAPGGGFAVMTGEETRLFMRGALEKGMRERRPGFELAGMAWRNHGATGYFIDPSRLDYVHVWRAKMSPVDRIVYSDTWRELMLIPVDGCLLPADVILTKEEGELRNMGFGIPECGRVTPLRLEDAERRYLRAVMESLRDHQEAALLLTDPESCGAELGMEVYQAHLQAIADLRLALGDY
jgi:hypothetical protein